MFPNTIIAVLGFSCGQIQETQSGPKTCEELFAGDHQLQLIQSDNDTSYMQITDGVVKYVWQLSDESYITSTIPISKIRIKIDETVNTPYIKYRWCSCTIRPGESIQEKIDGKVTYILLVCSKKDCPAKLMIVE